MKFTRIPTDTFKKLQLNAGVFARAFDATAGTIEEADIVGATSGGANFTAVPTFRDDGEDIDNCPKNTMELKRLDMWEIAMRGTFLTVDTILAKDLVAAADISENKITPRNAITTEDFKDLWWIGDYSDENGENGGFLAIHMMNALSTGGFSLQSGDKSKGQFAFTYTAHYSMAEQDKVPFEIYVKAGA